MTDPRHRLAHIVPLVGDEVRAGLYQVRLVPGAALSAVRIWFGPPIDREAPRFLDRSHRWQALCNGRRCRLERVWPRCVGEPIDLETYRYLVALHRWARRHDRDSPEATPDLPVDWSEARPPF